MKWFAFLILVFCLQTQAREIVVAVIDTGADKDHPMIKDKMWHNPREKLNGIDDDHNGFVDDINGWNFVDNNNEMPDDNGHGTHIAGLIARSPADIRLMILKYCSPGAETDPLKNTVRAIDYAVKMKVQVINYSGGGLMPSSEEKAALQRAGQAGILVIAAAGNEHSNSDLKPYFPADYGLSNIISVGALDSSNHLIESSNWGVKSVQLAALGSEVFSSLPSGHYGEMTGTSQATAQISRTIATAMSFDTALNTTQATLQKIQRSIAHEPNLRGRTRWEGKLNVPKMLYMQAETAGADNEPGPENLSFFESYDLFKAFNQPKASSSQMQRLW